MFSDPKKKKKGGQKATTIEELPDEDDELGDLDLDDDIPPKVSQCKFANMVVCVCRYLLSKLKQLILITLSNWKNPILLHKQFESITVIRPYCYFT